MTDFISQNKYDQLIRSSWDTLLISFAADDKSECIRKKYYNQLAISVTGKEKKVIIYVMHTVYLLLLVNLLQNNHREEELISFCRRQMSDNYKSNF
jgi:hypothetical protein